MKHKTSLAGLKALTTDLLWYLSIYRVSHQFDSQIILKNNQSKRTAEGIIKLLRANECENTKHIFPPAVGTNSLNHQVTKVKIKSDIKNIIFITFLTENIFVLNDETLKKYCYVCAVLILVHLYSQHRIERTSKI